MCRMTALATTVRERPILFSAPMVRALLDGRKTQTRRVVKLPGRMADNGYELERARVDNGGGVNIFARAGEQYLHVPRPIDETEARVYCPYGQPGDRLWVRETWLPDAPINGWPGDIEWDGCGRPADGVPQKYRSPAHCLYAATWKGTALRWRPSIHMPRWASRLTLEITDVRVERVRDISEDDARAEGAEPDASEFAGYTPYKSGFAHLWQQINGARGYGWDANPWVWVLSFRRIDR